MKTVHFSRIHTYVVYRNILSEIYRRMACLCIFAELTVWLKERLVFTLVSAMSFVVTINITYSTPRLEEVQIWAHHD